MSIFLFCSERLCLTEKVNKEKTRHNIPCVFMKEKIRVKAKINLIITRIPSSLSFYHLMIFQVFTVVFFHASLLLTSKVPSASVSIK